MAVNSRVLPEVDTFDRLAATILMRTNRTKHLRILKPGGIEQNPREDLKNQCAYPLEQLYFVRTSAGGEIVAGKHVLGCDFVISERRGRAVAHMG